MAQCRCRGVCVSAYNTVHLVPRPSNPPLLYHFEPWQFLVTFVISLMKSIDIRSENAVKLLAEFLDMDTQYVPGERHVNAEHFAHGPSEFWALVPPFAFWCSFVALFYFIFISIEIYCYLRSPYKDLGVYDSVVQVRTHRNAMTCVHMADFRFAQKSMTLRRVSFLPLHTSARVAGNLVSGRNHHVHSHPIFGHRFHVHILLCDPSAALHTPANRIRIA